MNAKHIKFLSIQMKAELFTMWKYDYGLDTWTI